jgi:hypothetical protein
VHGKKSVDPCVLLDIHPTTPSETDFFSHLIKIKKDHAKQLFGDERGAWKKKCRSLCIARYTPNDPIGNGFFSHLIKIKKDHAKQLFGDERGAWKKKCRSLCIARYTPNDPIGNGFFFPT